MNQIKEQLETLLKTNLQDFGLDDEFEQRKSVTTAVVSSVPLN